MPGGVGSAVSHSRGYPISAVACAEHSLLDEQTVIDSLQNPGIFLWEVGEQEAADCVIRVRLSQRKPDQHRTAGNNGDARRAFQVCPPLFPKFRWNLPFQQMLRLLKSVKKQDLLVLCCGEDPWNQ